MFSLLLTTIVAHAAETKLFEGSSGTHTFACAAGQAVTLKGTNNTLTLTGDCGALRVEGSSNKVIADGVASVTIIGTSNDVKYARNLSGKKKLTTSLSGVGNTVHL